MRTCETVPARRGRRGALPRPPPPRPTFTHVVAPGESLTSVAAADGLSVAQLAAANGISTCTELIAGLVAGDPAAGRAGVAAAGVRSDGAVERSATPPASHRVDHGRPAAAISSSPATRCRRSPRATGSASTQLAADNGLDPAGLLLAGPTLTSPAPAPAPAPAPSRLTRLSRSSARRGAPARRHRPYATAGDRQRLRGRLDRRRQRRPALARRGDRLTRRAASTTTRSPAPARRRDADRARHLELHRLRT